MRFLLIRHGEMAGDPFVCPSQPVSGCLSEAGVRQAEALGERLRGDKIDNVFTSPYGRAMETAQISLSGRGLQFEILYCLREWMPDRELVKSTRHEDIVRMDSERPAEETWKTELGEGTFDMYARICPGFLAALARIGLHSRCGGFVPDPGREDTCLAVFAHGGSLGILLSFLLEMRPFPVSRLGWELTGVARIEFSQRRGIYYPRLMID